LKGSAWSGEQRGKLSEIVAERWQSGRMRRFAKRTAILPLQSY
jgi:hypothetical protein